MKEVSAVIYCVEDEKNIRDLMIYTLKASGFEAQGFENSTGFWPAMKVLRPELMTSVFSLCRADQILLVLFQPSPASVW